MSKEEMEKDLEVKRFAVFVYGCFIGVKWGMDKYSVKRRVKEDWYSEKYGWGMDELMVLKVV